MSIDELTDCLSALNSALEQFLDSHPTEVTPQQKKELGEALEMAVNYLNEW